MVLKSYRVKFPEKKWSVCSVSYLLKRLKEIQYNTIKYLYSAYSHRVSRALRRRELISNVQKGRF